jgi:hypothetical protein
LICLRDPNKEPIHTQRFSQTARIENLIDKIQASLYGNDSQLAYVLTLASDLCNLINATQYKTWIEKELHGYENYQRFLDDFDSEEAFAAWMDEWGSHRMIRAYVEIYSRDDDGHNKINEFPYSEVLIAFPISELVSNIQSARSVHVDRVSRPIADLGAEKYVEFVSFMAEHNIPVRASGNTAVYFKVSDLERILVRVRAIVLKLLNEARKFTGGME